MKKLLLLACAMLITYTPTFAQSSSNGVMVGELSLVDNSVSPAAAEADLGYAGPWVTVLSTTLHTSQQKDLVAGVSLECGLGTMTQVKSKGGNKDTSTAEAGVQVRVVMDLLNGEWVDGYSREAAPGEVTYCERSQELSATLQGMIDLGCFVDHDNDPGTPDVFDPSQCDLTDEEIQLTLKTLNANAFFFVLDDVGSGMHSVSVQARVDTFTSSQNGSADASAMVGKGALTVEEVRLVKGTDITIN